jgi:DNA (cytosine-5)-methyltransferase 1
VPLRVIDLFCGCGGLSLGFQNAGFEIVAACDNWPPALAVYQHNFTHPALLQDITTLAAAELQQQQPDIIIGGPPCQDFSSAGRRSEQARADLTLVFAELVAAVQPAWVVMENVERIMQSQVLRQARDCLRQAGYALSETILNASRCGVPQQRKRYFLVGELHGRDHALLPYFERYQAHRPMTVYDYLGDSLGIEHYYRHPRTYARRAIFSIHEPAATVRGVNRPIPGTYQPHPGDTAPISPAVRPLTTRERSYLQTFPPEFILSGTKTDLEQMIGNAVPVKLAEFVARCLAQYQLERADPSCQPPRQPVQLPLL